MCRILGPGVYPGGQSPPGISAWLAPRAAGDFSALPRVAVVGDGRPVCCNFLGGYNSAHWEWGGGGGFRLKNAPPAKYFARWAVLRLFGAVRAQPFRPAHHLVQVRVPVLYRKDKHICMLK